MAPAGNYFVRHVERFLSEEFEKGRGYHINISALWKAYVLWCEAHRIVHRRMTTVTLLEHLEAQHGIAARNVYVNDRAVFALIGLRFRTEHFDKALRPRRNEDGYEGYAWRYRPTRASRSEDR